MTCSWGIIFKAEKTILPKTIIHKDRLCDIDALCAPLAASNVKLYCDDASYAALKQYPSELKNHATADDFGCEFQDYKMAIKTVDNIDGAIEHVSTYSSKHSEAIISEDPAALAKYVQLVDAACVYQNAPTSIIKEIQKHKVCNLKCIADFGEIGF